MAGMFAEMWVAGMAGYVFGFILEHSVKTEVRKKWHPEKVQEQCEKAARIGSAAAFILAEALILAAHS